MQAKKLILILVLLVTSVALPAQQFSVIQTVNVRSLQLYNQQQWVNLLSYGKKSLADGIDFPVLRMRLGYAAFSLGNYSESMRHYEKVYDLDNSNASALYFLYLTNLYLNNLSSARYYASLLDASVQNENKIKPFALSKLDAEFSQKQFNVAYRSAAQYSRLGVGAFLGYKLNLYQTVAFFNQTIKEPGLIAVTNNNNIQIKQKEYYAKAEFALNGHLTLLGGVHYLNTPFNNFLYHNIIGLGGLRYVRSNFHLTGLQQIGRIRDSAFSQSDAVLTLYPLGNTRLYFISRISYSKNVVFSQVAGYSPVKGVWIEGNATLGKYQTMVNNDALYVYDDIDQKKLRYGAGVFATIHKNVMLSLHYTQDLKIRYGTTNDIINQQSITGGIQCNF